MLHRCEVLQMTTDDNEQNNTGPPTLCVGGPLTKYVKNKNDNEYDDDDDDDDDDDEMETW